jgi:hypothetical protein
MLAKEANEKGFVTRVWKVNYYRAWEMAKEARINFIATDMVTERWAHSFPTKIPKDEER